MENMHLLNYYKIYKFFRCDFNCSIFSYNIFYLCPCLNFRMLVKKKIINYRIDADFNKFLNVLRAHPHLLVSPRQQNLIFRLDNSQCAYSFYEIYSIIKCIYYFAFCRKRNYCTNAQYTEYKYLYSERTVEFSFGSALATRGIVI